MPNSQTDTQDTYPPLPENSFGLFTANEMRAYVDADCTPSQQAVANAISVFTDVLGDIANWEDKALEAAVTEARAALRSTLPQTTLKSVEWDGN